MRRTVTAPVLAGLGATVAAVAAAFLAPSSPPAASPICAPAAGTPHASPAPAPATPSRSPDAVPEKEVRAALAWLAAQQDPTGAFGPPTPRVGTTALALLAFMAAGNTENRGPHATQVTRAIRYLMDRAEKRSDPNGRRPDGLYINFDQDNASQMHGHGFATLALSQACGMFGVRRHSSEWSDRLREVISGSVALILSSQAEVGDGSGWMYDPFNIADHEGSMTVCMIQALRSARDVGFAVPASVIDRAVRYVRRSRKDDGSFRYGLNQDRSSFELTAAAISTLLFAGHYDDRDVRLGREYLLSHGRLETFASHPTSAEFPFYGMFYTALCLWFDYDRDTFGRYFPAIVRWFLALHDPGSGRFRDLREGRTRREEYGDIYATAMATLTLQVPLGILPIFQR